MGTDNNSAPTDRNKRKNPRHRTFKAGTVVINNKTSTISCTIRNLSDGGAKLEVEGLFRPPHDFDIMVPTENWRADCQVVWREGKELGIRFVGDRSPLDHAGARSQVIGRL